MHHKYYNNNVIIEYNMIICSSSNIDIIQGNIGYNDPEGITDWRITNTASGSSGTLNILNSLSQTGRVTILDNGNLGIANTNPGSLLDVGGDINITGIYKRNNRDIISDTSNYALSTSNILVPRILTEVGFGSNYTSRLNTALNTRIDNTSNYVLATSNLLANRVSSQWTSVSSGVNYSIVSAITEPTLIPSRGYVNGSLIGEGIPVLFYRTLTFTYNQDNIVAYYKFNDSSSLGLDSNPSSTKYNLTPTIVGGTGGYNTIVGVEGSSFQATNDGDRLEGDLPLKSIFDSSVTGISICCWFYKKLATYDNIYNTQLFTFHNPSSTNQWVTISLSHYNNVYKTNFSFSYTSGETYSSGFGPILAFDTWYHIVLILTKTGNIKVYFNGVNLTLVSGTTDGNINTESTIRSYGSMTYPLLQCPNITKLKIFNDQTKFSGNIDEFYVFNKELTQTEINMLYNKKYSVPVNSWNINFPVSNTIMVNNTSKNVSGLYTISVGNATSSVLPASGQAIIPLPSTATTTITIKYPTQYITVANPYTYQVFTYTTETAGIGTGQTQYTFNAPSGGILCDILLVGGGGAGSGTIGGGGGAGALIFVRNAVLNGTYTINVGNGGTGGTQAQGAKGYSSIISQGSINITAEGGGASGRADGNQNGGSGGGGDYWEGNQSGGTSTSYTSTAFGASIIKYGNNGANAYTPSPFNGGGGGGAGSSALIATSTNLFSNGGSGLYQVTIDGITINFATHFGTNTAQVGGVLFNGNLYYGGGGGAGGNLNSTGGSGGLGGGGDGGPGVAVGGANIPIHGSNGFPNTGGGGGGGSNHPSLGGNGGSGIVIIRYLSPTNVGIGTTTPVTELHVYDDTTNNTTLTMENNYIDPVVINPNTVGYTATETLESSKFYRTLTFNYFPNYPENPPNTALLAWYRFDGDGLDYNPYATKYNLIANAGTPTYSSGTSADSFFQGRRYINTSTGSLRNTSLSLASRAFSVSMWMRTKNSGVIFFVAQGTAGTNTTVLLGNWSNNTYGLAFHSNDLAAAAYTGDLNTWVHMVFVVLPNYNRRVYRNGVLIASDSNTTASNAVGDLRFGANYTDNANLNVDISDLRIYNNGLSATEVATLYNSYTSLVITDNYAINFNKSSTVLVNSVSKTVNGLYNISMGHINSSMLPAAGQADTPLASTATRSVAIKYEYSNTSTSLPNLITVAGATSSIIGTTERAISFTYTSDSSGLTGQTQYSFTPTEDLWCDILVVGGGGGGGHGGGGGGGVLFGTNLKINAGVNVSVKVGNGGAGVFPNSPINGANGADSSIIFNSIEYIAKGGGGGGSRSTSVTVQSGSSGGSGGGGAHANSAPQGLGGVSNKITYANFQSFGNNGGIGRPNTSGSEPNHTSGGGGGAGSAGNDFSYTTGGGNGGQGKEFVSYFGTNVGDNGYFGGGGGGQTAFSGGNRGYGNGGLGLYGGGGNSAYEWDPILFAHNGLSNTGGGGGGGRFQGTAQGIGYTERSGNGGTGFVIIRYRRNLMQSAALELIRNSGILPTEIIVTGTTSATISGTTDRYISFPYSGTGTTRDYSFTTTEPLICDILVVGGGGGGGKRGGAGGGAGGLLYHKNVFLNTATFAISVGKGGLHGGLIGQDQGNSGSTGSDSSISIDGTTRYLAKGGGGGQGDSNDINTSGGSSGGGTWAGAGDGLSTNNIFNGSVVSVVNNQYVNTLTSPEGCRGNIGGNQLSNYRGGGGGGAGSAGMNHNTETTTDDGYGGLGLSIDITGTPIVYAGGGNGSDYSAGRGEASGNQIQSFNPVYPTIESRGGGGYASDSGTAESGLDGTGGGGGGQGTDAYGFFGGSGGSGIVIIRYRKANTNYKIGNYGGDFKIISSTQSADTDYMRITRDGASIYNPTGSPQWSTTSDRRIKENIEKASYTKCYDNINKLELYRFNYIKDFNNINKDLRQLGYIAQEVNDIFPKAVTTQHFNNQNLSIPDLLTIDITQINYSLYGAVKKLIEMYNDIGKKINVLEKLLNIDTSASDLIIADEITTSNIIITEASTSNLTTDTSNLITDTSNLIITEVSTSNITTDTSNVIITEVSTSNLITDTSNVIITEASTSNIKTDTSNIIITESSTSNIIITEVDTSNLIITEASTSNLTTDTSNIIITEASTSNLIQDAS